GERGGGVGRVGGSGGEGGDGNRAHAREKWRRVSRPGHAPAMTAVSVTATGTDIGKTFVTRGLIGHFIACDRQVDALKPVVSGFDEREAEGSDPGLLLAALGRDTTPKEIARVAPWRFAAPLSP